MGSGGMLTSAAGYARSAKKRLGDYGQWQQHQMMRPVRLMPVSYRGCAIAVVAKHPGPPRSWTNAGRDDWDQPHERPVAACMLSQRRRQTGRSLMRISDPIRPLRPRSPTRLSASARYEVCSSHDLRFSRPETARHPSAAAPVSLNRCCHISTRASLRPS